MSSIADEWSSLWPALAFLVAGVPLAALLDRLGFFEALVSAVSGREGDTPVLALWIVAALTTVVLNLDTTIVLLTPLYLRFAKRADTEVMPLVVIPLLLASLSSSVLPVSNLTNLIVVDQLHVGVGDFLSHLAVVDGVHRMSWGISAWLLGVNVAAAAVPIGAIANLLWLRILRAEGLTIGVRRYVRITLPIVVPAFATAAIVLAGERLVSG
jgi:Na+/H+ antiporter NhaD/arsenite permease-like protein